MGYYTYYTMHVLGPVSDGGAATWSPSPVVWEELDREIRKMNMFTDGGNAENGYSCYDRWYSWDEDMRLLSSRFPELVFCLHGEGEGPEDLWNAYFLNGAYQYCPASITYEDFDAHKLLPPNTAYSPSDTYSYQCEEVIYESRYRSLKSE